MIILGKCWPTLNKELVLYSTSPILESWFIFLLLHNHITSLWQVQQLLTWKSNIRKVSIFSCLLMWCSSWKQGGEAAWGDLTALPTTTWAPLLWTGDQHVGKPFFQAWVCPLCPDAVASLPVLKSSIGGSFPGLHSIISVCCRWVRKSCVTFCLC